MTNAFYDQRKIRKIYFEFEKLLIISKFCENSKKRTRNQFVNRSRKKSQKRFSKRQNKYHFLNRNDLKKIR